MMHEAWDSARSMLAVRLDGIGDLLMTTPALHALKHARPGRTLTLLTSPAAGAVARELPFVDHVIPFVAPWMKAAESVGAPCDATLALVRTLRERTFDAGIVFTVCTQSALPPAMLLFEAGVPLRAAYARENPYALLTDWRRDPDRELAFGMRHEVQRHIDLVQSLGVAVHDERLQFPVRGDARRAMLAKATAAGLDVRRRWLVVHPGASAPSRRYPEAKLAEAVRLLAADGRWQIVVAGGADDVARAEAIAARVPDVVSLAGRLDWPELAALIASAEAIVCNNSGPAHLAAAVDTPVVDLYALTNPQHTPWRVAHRVLWHDVDCRFCLRSVCPHGHQRCLAGIAPTAIVDAVLSLVAPASRARRASGVASHASACP
jgi:lipopolysaccharide heptosyltransferase II